MEKHKNTGLQNEIALNAVAQMTPNKINDNIKPLESITGRAKCCILVAVVMRTAASEYKHKV